MYIIDTIQHHQDSILECMSDINHIDNGDKKYYKW